MSKFIGKMFDNATGPSAGKHQVPQPQQIEEQEKKEPNTSDPTSSANSHQESPPSYSKANQVTDSMITLQGTASSTLVAFVTAIYQHLTQNVQPVSPGGVTPEKMGALASLGGYGPEQNRCRYKITEYSKATAENSPDLQLEELGAKEHKGAAFIDAQFTLYYNCSSFVYTTLYRPPAPRSRKTLGSKILGVFLPPQRESFAPLLKLDGLLAWYVVKILTDPQGAFVSMNRTCSSVLLESSQEYIFSKGLRREQFPAHADQLAIREKKRCIALVTVINDADEEDMRRNRRRGNHE
jgi:hypothetical protein